MKHNEYGNAADIVGMVSSVLGTMEKKIAEQQKKVEAYEKAWKKKNPLRRNFCKVNKGEQPIEVAEDFACHVIAQVLTKKIVGKSHDEIKTIYSEMNDKIIKEVLEFNDVYAYMLAMGAAASREKEGGDQ